MADSQENVEVPLPAELATPLQDLMLAAKRLTEEIQGMTTAQTSEERTCCLKLARIYLERVRTNIDVVALGIQQAPDFPDAFRSRLVELVESQRGSLATSAAQLEEHERASAMATGVIGKA
ncbi:MAG: hypothetical protein ABW061_26230 [Polyangiaceae bacterium]